MEQARRCPWGGGARTMAPPVAPPRALAVAPVHRHDLPMFGRPLPLALALALATLGCSSDKNGGPAAPDGPPPQGCTEEAKICPDGSSVGRVGPSCEFAPCPDSTAPPPASGPAPEATCKDECGNGTCEEVVCMAVGCPCAETKESCPADCE